MSTPSIVIVTGGNSGIGYETAKALLQSSKPFHILLGSRITDKGTAAIESLKAEVPESQNTLELLHVDLTSDESIEAASKHVLDTHGHVDILVNNAGATFDLEFIAGRASLRECFTRAYDVNVAGTQVMTWTFMPLLLKSSEPRLIFVAGLANINKASEAYFPTPPQPAGWPKNIGFETIGYRCSKVALNMMMLDWNHKLKEDGVKVFCVGPGMLATNLGGLGPEAAAKIPGVKHPSIGGALIRKVVEGERDRDVGKIVVQEGVSMW